LKKDKVEEENDGQNTKFLGIFLAAISGLFFTLCSVMVKLLPKIDPSEVLLFRALVQFVLTVPMMLLAKANPLGPKGKQIC
jgi:drug/metabolite transporter (DMT)-like permease